MNAIKLAIGFIVGIAVCLAPAALVMLEFAFRGDDGQANEDDGADVDAGIDHRCYRCRCHISGALDGTPAFDTLCYTCWSHQPVDDADAVPSYVHHTTTTNPSTL